MYRKMKIMQRLYGKSRKMLYSGFVKHTRKVGLGLTKPRFSNFKEFSDTSYSKKDFSFADVKEKNANLSHNKNIYKCTKTN